MSSKATANSEKTVRVMASAALLLVTVLWGSSFVVMKTSIDSIRPAYILAYRFTIAAVGLTLIFWRKVRTMSGEELRCGSIMGCFLFVSYLFQTKGLQYTTASKNAFITTLYVILVPFFHWLFDRVRPTRNNGIAAVLAVIGLSLISLKGDMTVNYGDFLTFVCSIFYAFHVLFTGKYSSRLDPIRLSVMQMAVAAVLAWAVAAVTEGPCDFGVFADRGILASVLYLGLVPSMLCFLLQTVGQKYVNPGTASILLSFESVFGFLFSVFFLHDPVTVKILAGCGLMFAAAILAEVGPSEEKKPA